MLELSLKKLDEVVVIKIALILEAILWAIPRFFIIGTFADILAEGFKLRKDWVIMYEIFIMIGLLTYKIFGEIKIIKK